MAFRGAGWRARARLWPLVALLTLAGFAWMHVLAVTDPGTAEHLRVAAPAAGPHAEAAHAVHDGGHPGSVVAGDPANSAQAGGLALGPDAGLALGPGGHGDGHGGGHGGGHATMVGCLLAVTGIAVLLLARRPTSAPLPGPGRDRGGWRSVVPSAALPRSCGPPRLALCVLRV